MAETTTDKILNEYPPDLVCERLVRSLDGVAILGSDLQAWVDETHPDALKHIALEMLRASQMIPETETESGEGSGGSSAS